MAEYPGEKIGGVTLNYRFYRGTDTYRDGDAEDRILQIVREKADDAEEALTDGSSWPMLYHLSPVRENLLEWYDFGEGKTLLEIGSGCGAMTGLFCRKLAWVTAVDLSRKRSLINATRNKNHDNLEILVGNLEDIRTDEKYDYVTLIGVLENAGSFAGGPDPFTGLLEKAGEYLKPDGRLIIAIENKYGIKYWAGAAEDRTGRLFDGLRGYRGTDRVRTFSRQGLENLVRAAGFTDQEFYYPLPDYRFPQAVYSEHFLPRSWPVFGNSPNYDRDRYEVFSEEQVMNELIRDGRFEEFANSFLVVCRRAQGGVKKPGDVA